MEQKNIPAGAGIFSLRSQIEIGNGNVIAGGGPATGRRGGHPSAFRPFMWFSTAGSTGLVKRLTATVTMTAKTAAARVRL